MTQLNEHILKAVREYAKQSTEPIKDHPKRTQMEKLQAAAMLNGISLATRFLMEMKGDVTPAMLFSAMRAAAIELHQRPGDEEKNIIQLLD